MAADRISHLPEESHPNKLQALLLVLDDSRRGWRGNFGILSGERRRGWLCRQFYGFDGGCLGDVLSGLLNGLDVGRRGVGERVAARLRKYIHIRIRRHRR